MDSFFFTRMPPSQPFSTGANCPLCPIRFIRFTAIRHPPETNPEAFLRLLHVRAGVARFLGNSTERRTGTTRSFDIICLFIRHLRLILEPLESSRAFH